LGEGTALSYVVLLLLGLSIVPQLLGKLLEAYEGLSEREPRRLRRLAEHCPSGSETRRFVEDAVEREIFRKTLRLPVAVPLTRESTLKRLHGTGRFTLDELRSLSPLLRSREDGKVVVRVDAPTAASFWWSVANLCILLAYTLLYIAPALSGDDLALKVGALVFVLVFGVLTAFLVKQMQPVFLAHQARKRLEIEGLLAEDERGWNLLDPIRMCSFLLSLCCKHVWRRLLSVMAYAGRRLRFRS
jgi:hypothetical protein